MFREMLFVAALLTPVISLASDFKEEFSGNKSKPESHPNPALQPGKVSTYNNYCSEDSSIIVSAGLGSIAIAHNNYCSGGSSIITKAGCTKEEIESIMNEL